MSIGIIGGGAIGGLIAGYLVDKGEEVILVTSPRQVEEIAQRGLSIEGVRGRLFVRLTAKKALDQKVDLAIIATKIPDLAEAIARNAKYLKGIPVVSVQNGVRGERIIAEMLGDELLVPSIVMFGATYLAPGRIVHNFEGDWVIGKAKFGTDEVTRSVHMVIAKAFSSVMSDDITGMKWLKLFLNANNCLPAIIGKSIQETFRHRTICKIGVRIWQEGLQVAKEANIRLCSLPTFPVQRLADLCSMPLEQAADILSMTMTNLSKESLYGSILQSIRRGRPSEIDYINGEFVNLANSLGKSAPLNELLVRMVHEVEESGRYLNMTELVKKTRKFIS